MLLSWYSLLLTFLFTLIWYMQFHKIILFMYSWIKFYLISYYSFLCYCIILNTLFLVCIYISMWNNCVLFHCAVLVTFWYKVHVNFIKQIGTLFIFSTIWNSLNSIRIMCSLKVWKNLPIKHLGIAPFMDEILGDWFLFLPWIVGYSDCQIW